MAISPAPKRKTERPKAVQTDVKAERKAKEVINRGGSTSADINEQSTPAVKIVNVGLLTPEVEEIAMLRELRPRNPRSKRKTPISLHAWLVEAAQEKIEREKKKYGINA